MIHTSENNDLEWLVGMMLPRMKAHQVVEEDFSIDTFKGKLNHEAESKSSCFYTRYGLCHNRKNQKLINKIEARTRKMGSSLVYILKVMFKIHSRM